MDALLGAILVAFVCFPTHTMLSDAASLLASVHGQALRILSARLGAHYDGLGVASRAARRQGVLGAAMCKKLHNLDVAFAFSRHITGPMVVQFVDKFSAELEPVQEPSTPDLAAAPPVLEVVAVAPSASQGDVSVDIHPPVTCSPTDTYSVAACPCGRGI